MKNSILWIAVAVLGGVLVAVSLYYGGIVGNHLRANYQKRVVTSQVEQRVRTPEFAQAAYERFFEDCNAVVADNAKIKIAKQRVRAAKAAPNDVFGTKAAKVSDAESDLAGVEQSQAETAAFYNAAASEYTRGQFLAENLPAELVAPYTNVSCR